jgi:hypothetical protein
MFTRFKNRLANLRQQPEHIRLQAAIRYTLIAGVILAALWLLVFLPFQIRTLFS